MSLKNPLIASLRSFWSCIGHIVQFTFTLSLGISACGFGLTSAQIHDEESVEREGIEFFLENGTIANGSQINSFDNETNWEDGNWRRKDHSRIAAIAVYCSVILIAIFGILVKYFVTQYETLQAKAQLEYQQLRNVQIQ